MVKILTTPINEKDAEHFETIFAHFTSVGWLLERLESNKDTFVFLFSRWQDKLRKDI